MAFREVRVFEIREVLRLWLRGEGLRPIERLAVVDRKSVRVCRGFSPVGWPASSRWCLVRKLRIRPRLNAARVKRA
jgi:hypothetical protein